MREHDFFVGILESLESKAGIALAASLALVTIAATADGHSSARWGVGVLAFIAGILSATVLAPTTIRVLSTTKFVDTYGSDAPARFNLQAAAQYADAAQALHFASKVKVLRLRAALLLLFASAVCLALV